MDLSRPFTLANWTITPGLNTLDDGHQTITLPPKVMLLLLLLAEHYNEPVSQDKIFASLWPEQVVSDSSIYQAIAQLRKALDDDKQKGIIERISGQGYRLTLKPQPLKTRPKLDRPGLGVLGLMIVIVCGIIWQTTNTPPSTPGPMSYSSLTIEPVHAESDNAQRMAISLHDLILTRLISLPDLAIIQHQNLKNSLADSAYTSDLVLSGRMQVQNERIRVTMNLTEIDGNQVIWAQLFEQPANQIQQLENAITQALLTFFETRQLSSSHTDLHITPQDHNQYLLARFLWNQRTPQSLLQAKQIYEQLQQQQRLFPLAAVGLCETYYYLYMYHDWQFADVDTRCGPLLEQALAASPDLGQALAAQANLLGSKQQYQQAEQHFQRAIALAPNYALAHLWYGQLLREEGKYQASLAKIQHAYFLDPMSAHINLGLAYAHLNLRDIEQAQNFYQRAVTLAPNHNYAAIRELDFYPLTQARATRLLNWVKHNPKALRIQPNYHLSYIMVLLAVGDSAAARASFDELDEVQVNPSYRLYVEASLLASEQQHLQAVDVLSQRYQLMHQSADFVLPLINQLLVVGDNQQAIRLLETHFAADLSATQVTKDELFIISLWLMAQPGELTDKQLALRNQIDRMLVQGKDLLSAEWWAYRQRHDKVQTTMQHFYAHHDINNLEEDHLQPWRIQRLQTYLEN